MKKPVVSADGNAFTIMGEVSKALKQAGRGDEVDKYITEAKSGDYDHLLEVSMKYVDFGDAKSNAVVNAMEMLNPDEEDECF